MSSAEPCKDLKLGFPSLSRVNDEESQQDHRQDDQLSSIKANSPWRRFYKPWSKDEMPSFRRSYLTILILAFLTVAYASVPANRRPQDTTADEQATFQDLLNSVSDASIHEVLKNVYEKYKHGVFPEDRTAMKAVHSENAAMATSLVELARRQNANGTSASPDTSTTVIVVVPTTQTNTVIQASGTDSGVVVQTQTTVTPVDTSVAPVQTTAPQASASAHGTTSAKGTATSPAATTLRTASAGAASTSPGQSGSSSATPPAATTKGSSTRQIVFTTTLPNGSQSTITSYTVVPAGEQASTPGVTGTSSTGAPSLQNGAPDGVQPRRTVLAGSLAAALVFVIGIL